MYCGKHLILKTWHVFWNPCGSASNKLVTRVHHSIKVGKVCQVKILRLNCYMEIKTRLPAVATGSTILMTDSSYSVYSSVETKVTNLFPNREPLGVQTIFGFDLGTYELVGGICCGKNKIYNQNNYLTAQKRHNDDKTNSKVLKTLIFPKKRCLLTYINVIYFV